ncbi:MAG: hypothetical protein AAFV29_19295 [Myxococcota bacterium]
MPADAAAPPALKVRELRLRRPGSADTIAIDRIVRIGLPVGWTGELEDKGRTLRLYGPEGEGKMLVAAALHPSELHLHLTELKSAQPSATPTPPEKLDIPGIRPLMGERATRFAIKGREMGEMVLIEKRDTIVLIVTVVDPNAWPRVRRLLAKAYPTVAIEDAPRSR